MPKSIVFCADGTWNGPGEPDSDDPRRPWSNVFKLFLNLAGIDNPATTQLEKEQDRTLTAANGTVEQVAKYLHGVGDSMNLLAKLVGGGFGVGLITRIVRGYTFISRNYQTGDKIYLVGFSRGAYTVRALAGLISAKGLLSAKDAGTAGTNDDKGPAYRLGAAVWYQWRHEVLRTQPHLLDHFEEIMLDLPGFLRRPPAPASMVHAPVEAVAVWDTVGALGIPKFDGQHVAVDLFQFADKALTANVRFGRHAISIDEQREEFAPTLWNPDANRIAQVLFPGAHADVGGGYPLSGNESGLSDGALEWIGRELRILGVRFATPPRVGPTPDPAGVAHQPWNEPLWKGLPRRTRALPAGLGLSKSVIDRINAGSVKPDPAAVAAAYSPTSLAQYVDGMRPSRAVQVIDCGN
jgi:Uncharacterized alpha/beta hydrolase domain (DUF2235)